MEATEEHFHVIFYLIYILRLRNPFLSGKDAVHPYLLNTMHAIQILTVNHMGELPLDSPKYVV